MATVEGITAQRGAELEGGIIVGGRLVNRTVFLVRRDGKEFPIGEVVPEPYEMYPVGSLYFTTVNTAAAELLGGGTWALYNGITVPSGCFVWRRTA